jgi:hypothetical protein
MDRTNARVGRLRVVLRGMVAALASGAAIGAAMATGTTLPTAIAQPLGSTDALGFVNSPVRCDPQQTAVVVGRTKLSLTAICADGRGHYEYRGVRLADQALQRLPATKLANGCFGARTDQVSYTVSERKLLLTSGPRVIRDEAMVAFKDYRVAKVAPVSERVEQMAGGASGGQKRSDSGFKVG